MPIYDFPEVESAEPPLEARLEEGAQQPKVRAARGQIFSAIAARLFFLLLLVADLLWICYSLAAFVVSVLGCAATRGKAAYFKNLSEKAWITLRRAIVCGVSLMVALFSPAFGIMIACTYFLMYDKSGIEEVIPSSLQSQFKEFLPQGTPKK